MNTADRNPKGKAASAWISMCSPLCPASPWAGLSLICWNSWSLAHPVPAYPINIHTAPVQKDFAVFGRGWEGFPHFWCSPVGSTLLLDKVKPRSQTQKSANSVYDILEVHIPVCSAAFDGPGLEGSADLPPGSLDLNHLLKTKNKWCLCQAFPVRN